MPLAALREEVAAEERARLVSSNRKPHSQPCGTCGASSQRTRVPPSASDSPSASARGARSARSFIDTMRGDRPHSGCGVRRGGEELVERPALVGLDVRSAM